MRARRSGSSLMSRSGRVTSTTNSRHGSRVAMPTSSSTSWTMPSTACTNSTRPATRRSARSSRNDSTRSQAHACFAIAALRRIRASRAWCSGSRASLRAFTRELGDALGRERARCCEQRIVDDARARVVDRRALPGRKHASGFAQQDLAGGYIPELETKLLCVEIGVAFRNTTNLETDRTALDHHCLVARDERADHAMRSCAVDIAHTALKLGGLRDMQTRAVRAELPGACTFRGGVDRTGDRFGDRPEAWH